MNAPDVIVSDQASTGDSLDSATFRQALRAFATGVTIITTSGPDGAMSGLTVNSFSSVSLDPPMVLWSLRRSSLLLDTFRASGRFAVNVLAEDQIDLSNRFASPASDRFSGIDIEISPLDLPLLVTASAHLECTVEATYDGGDHVIFLGRVLSCRASGRVPLVFALGAYRRLLLEV